MNLVELVLVVAMFVAFIGLGGCVVFDAIDCRAADRKQEARSEKAARERRVEELERAAERARLDALQDTDEFIRTLERKINGDDQQRACRHPEREHIHTWSGRWIRETCTSCGKTWNYRASKLPESSWGA